MAIYSSATVAELLEDTVWNSGDPKDPEGVFGERSGRETKRKTMKSLSLSLSLSLALTFVVLSREAPILLLVLTKPLSHELSHSQPLNPRPPVSPLARWRTTLQRGKRVSHPSFIRVSFPLKLGYKTDITREVINPPQPEIQGIVHFTPWTSCHPPKLETILAPTGR